MLPQFTVKVKRKCICFLFPLVPAFFPVSKRHWEQRKALIYQCFLDFVKGCFPFFPLFLKTPTRKKTYTLILLNCRVCVCLYIGVIFFDGKNEKNEKKCYILEITSANHHHLYIRLMHQCRLAFDANKPY